MKNETVKQFLIDTRSEVHRFVDIHLPREEIVHVRRHPELFSSEELDELDLGEYR